MLRGHELTIQLATTSQTIVVPHIPKAEELRAAAEKAFVAVPKSCAELCKLSSNLVDGSGAKHWLGRADYLEQQQGLADCLSQCGLDWILFCHGSSGLMYGSWKWMVQLVSHGFGFIALDSFAHSKALKLRHKEAVPGLERLEWFHHFDIKRSVYGSNCSWSVEDGEFPFCYSTDAANVIANPDAWKEFYERLYLLRQRELDMWVASIPRYVSASKRLFFMGVSEGGMVAAKYWNRRLEERLAGRVILSWSCETNYFSTSKLLCEGRCSKRTPLLNLIGTEDEFFSSHKQSISNQVASAGASTSHFQGHCRRAFAEGKFEQSMVVALQEALHDVLATHGRVARHLVIDFLSNPSGFTSGNSSTLAKNCQFQEPGLFQCPADSVRRSSKVGADEGQAYAVTRSAAPALPSLQEQLVQIEDRSRELQELRESPLLGSAFARAMCLLPGLLMIHAVTRRRYWRS